MRAPASPGSVFVGARLGKVGPALVCASDGLRPPAPLPPRNDLRNHSPDGFQWGYGGSGPSQLALAMVAWATGDDALALRVYQQLKADIIAPLEGDSWVMECQLIAELARSLDAPDIGQPMRPTTSQAGGTGQSKGE